MAREMTKTVKREWRRNWIVFTAVIVHGIWGLLLLFSEAPMHVTPIADFIITNHYAAALCYLLAAGAALVPCVRTEIDDSFLGLCLVIPQQYLLMVSAWTGVMCGIRGQYPDGYIPDGGAAFIWADQAWAIIGMFVHTAALIDWFWFSTKMPEDKYRSRIEHHMLCSKCHTDWTLLSLSEPVAIRCPFCESEKTDSWVINVQPPKGTA